MKSFVRKFLILVALILVGFIVINYYSYIFSKTVEGEIVGVERVTDPTMVIGAGTTPAQMYSFAVALRDQKSGTIYTASSEDRQWAVAKKGYCAKATLFRYPPWYLAKAGTYFGARLDELSDCNHVQDNPCTGAPVGTPSSSPVPSATP